MFWGTNFLLRYFSIHLLDALKQYEYLRFLVVSFRVSLGLKGSKCATKLVLPLL